MSQGSLCTVQRPLLPAVQSASFVQGALGAGPAAAVQSASFVQGALGAGPAARFRIGRGNAGGVRGARIRLGGGFSVHHMRC